MAENTLNMIHPRLLTFRDLVLEKNKVLNLTAIRDPEQFYQKHLLDSLACARLWSDGNLPKKIIDVGTGAGFPGMVLAIAYPEITFTLVESIHKKAQFLEEVKQQLSVTNVEIINERAETLAQSSIFKRQFDIAIARAVAPLELLLPLLEPFIKHEGQIVAMKGQKIEAELKNAVDVMKQCNIHVKEHIAYTLPQEICPRKLLILTH